MKRKKKANIFRIFQMFLREKSVFVDRIARVRDHKRTSEVGAVQNGVPRRHMDTLYTMAIMFGQSRVRA